jgi:sec-independent protein translocase protein TatA
MPNVGPIEIIVVILILIVIFGPKRIPELGKSVGQGMRNFKQSVTGRDRDDEPRELERERQSAPVATEPAPVDAEPVRASAAVPRASAPPPESGRTSERTREPGA